MNASDLADAPPLEDEVCWTARDIVVCAGIVVLGTFALAALLIASPLGPDPEADSFGIGFFWIAAVLQGVLTLFVLWRYIVRRYSLSWSGLGLRRPVGKHVTLLALAALLGSLGFTALYGAVVSTLGLDFLLPEPVPHELADRRFFVITAIVIAGWIPFAEEVFFRGFVFSGLAVKYGIVAAGAISAALFSVAPPVARFPAAGFRHWGAVRVAVSQDEVRLGADVSPRRTESDSAVFCRYAVKELGEDNVWRNA